MSADDRGGDGSDRTARRASHVADILIAGAVIVAPHLVGTVHPWSWLVVLALSSAALFLLASDADRIARPPALVLALLSLAGVAVLAPLVPLPRLVLDRISPAVAWAWELGAGEAAVSTRHFPAHLAPGAGRFEALRWLAATVFVFACGARAADPRWRHAVSRLVVWACALAGLACVVHTLLGLRDVYGLYGVRWDRRETWLAPLINENHWASFLSLGTGAGLAVLLGRRPTTPGSVVLALCTAGSAALVLASPSRSGILGLATILVLFIVYGVLGPRRPAGRHQTPRPRRGGPAAKSGPAGLDSPRPRRSVVRRLVLVVVAVALCAGVVALAGLAVERRTRVRVDPLSGASIGGFEQTLRFRLLPDSWDMARAHQLTGVGRGAFGDVHPRYSTWAGSHVATSAENWPLQLVADHGLLLGAALGGVILSLLLAAIAAGWSESHRRGAAASLVGLAVHDLADFSMQCGAVVLAAAVLVAVALGSDRARTFPSRYARRGLLLAGLLVAWLAPGLRHWDSSRCQARVEAAVARGDMGLAEAVGAEARWHPSSFPMALTFGTRYAAAGDAKAALRWLNRAQLLAPRHAWPHMSTARLLADTGHREQALIEYRLAAKEDWEGTARQALEEVAVRWPDPAAILAISPDSEPAATALLALWLSESGRTALSDEAARMAWDLRPEVPASAAAWASVLARTGRGEEAIRLVRETWAGSSVPSGIRVLLGECAIRAGHAQEGLAMLREIADGPEDPGPSGWLALGAAEARYGEPGPARVALRRVRRSGWKSATARSFVEEAILEESLGGTDAALQLARRAVEADERLVDGHLLLARLLDARGRDDEALAAVSRALVQDGDNPAAIEMKRRLLEAARDGAGARTGE